MHIKKYKIIKSLEKTSKWELFLAKHSETDLYVKIRIFNPTLTSNENVRNRLMGSLEYFYLMRNKYSISILEFGYLDKNTIYEVLEHLDYLNLRSIINIAKRIPPEIASIILKEILNGLNQAHERGLFHGYLSPYSIVSSTNGIIKIQDISYSINEEYFHNFICSESMLNNLYYAPEHILKAEINQKTDLFLTGVIAYEMLTGKHPFWRADKPWDSMKILSENPEPIFWYVPHINSNLERVIEKLMQIEVNKRYDNAKEALEDLEPYIKSLGDYKSYEVLAAYFIDPKTSTEKIERQYFLSLYDDARTNFYHGNYNKALFQMQIILHQNYKYEGIDVYINDIKEKKRYLPVKENIMKSIEDCKNKLEYGINNVELLIKLAKLNLEIGNYLDAVYYAKKTIQIDNKNIEALEIIKNFIDIKEEDHDNVNVLSRTIIQSSNLEERQDEITFSIYKKLLIVIIFLGIIILIMNYYGWINFSSLVKEVSAYDLNKNYDQIESAVLNEVRNKIERIENEQDKIELLRKLMYLDSLNLSSYDRCKVINLLNNFYLITGDYIKSKESITKLRRICSDLSIIKQAYKDYARRMEEKGNYYEAMNIYIELLLNLRRSDPDYIAIEEKVKELQKILIGGISIKIKENNNKEIK